MYYPNPWWATSDCPEDSNPDTCQYLAKVPGEMESCTGVCDNRGDLVMWYTNFTSVAKRTISKDFMHQPGKRDVGGPGRWGPWAAPGSAPIVGEGCGVQGGNPFGSGSNGCGTASEHVVGRCCGGGEKGKLKLIRPHAWNIVCFNFINFLVRMW